MLSWISGFLGQLEDGVWKGKEMSADNNEKRK